MWKPYLTDQTKDLIQQRDKKARDIITGAAPEESDITEHMKLKKQVKKEARKDRQA